MMIALFIISISVSVASASETGLFGKMIETEYTDDRLEAIDNAAETVSISQTTGQTTVEISQAYYEGNRIYISYHVNGAAEILDGLELEDGSFADIIAGGEVQQDDGTVIGWRECIVPEDEITDPQMFCLAYKTPGSSEKQLLKFSLKHNAYDHILQGVSPATDYHAHAILCMGKVDLKGAVILTSPEQAASWLAWQEGEETGTDVIACWNLYQNNELVSYDLFASSEVLTDGVIFSVLFPFMEDLSGLMLVPEYSEGGEKPEEAIVLELMNQQEEESPLVSLANPWTELPTKQQLEDVTGVSFSIPEDAENIRYRCLQDEGLAEIQFPGMAMNTVSARSIRRKAGRMTSPGCIMNGRMKKRLASGIAAVSLAVRRTAAAGWKGACGLIRTMKSTGLWLSSRRIRAAWILSGSPKRSVFRTAQVSLINIGIGTLDI